MDDAKMTLPERLKALGERATKGPWLYGRIDPQTATSPFWQPYSPQICGNGPRFVTGDKGAVLGIHADDMALIAELRNALPELLAALENDARYRWLRADRDGVNHADPFIGRYINGIFSRWTDKEADTAIDAAMAYAARPTACATKGDGNG